MKNFGMPSFESSPAGGERPDFLQEMEALEKDIQSRLKGKYEDVLGIEAWRDMLIREGKLAPKELLNLTSDIALLVNTLHLDGYMPREEAIEILGQLQLSRGRDNLKTIALLILLGERVKTKKMGEEGDRY